MAPVDSDRGADRTRVIFAVVVRVDLEAVVELKGSLKDLGAEIVYQRITSTDRRLIIQEEGYDDNGRTHPRDEIEGERRR